MNFKLPDWDWSKLWKGLGFMLGGAGIGYASHLIPGKWKYIGYATSSGILGVGAYEIYEGVKPKPPPSLLTPEDLKKIHCKIYDIKWDVWGNKMEVYTQWVNNTGRRVFVFYQVQGNRTVNNKTSIYRTKTDRIILEPGTQNIKFDLALGYNFIIIPPFIAPIPHGHTGDWVFMVFYDYKFGDNLVWSHTAGWSGQFEKVIK